MSGRLELKRAPTVRAFNEVAEAILAELNEAVMGVTRDSIDLKIRVERLRACLGTMVRGVSKESSVQALVTASYERMRAAERAADAKIERLEGSFREQVEELECIVNWAQESLVLARQIAEDAALKRQKLSGQCQAVKRFREGKSQFSTMLDELVAEMFAVQERQKR